MKVATTTARELAESRYFHKHTNSLDLAQFHEETAQKHNLALSRSAHQVTNVGCGELGLLPPPMASVLST